MGLSPLGGLGITPLFKLVDKAIRRGQVQYREKGKRRLLLKGEKGGNQRGFFFFGPPKILGPQGGFFAGFFPSPRGASTTMWGNNTRGKTSPPVLGGPQHKEQPPEKAEARGVFQPGDRGTFGRGPRGPTLKRVFPAKKTPRTHKTRGNPRAPGALFKMPPGCFWGAPPLTLSPPKRFLFPLLKLFLFFEFWQKKGGEEKFFDPLFMVIFPRDQAFF